MMISTHNRRKRNSAIHDLKPRRPWEEFYIESDDVLVLHRGELVIVSNTFVDKIREGLQLRCKYIGDSKWTDFLMLDVPDLVGIIRNGSYSPYDFRCPCVCSGTCHRKYHSLKPLKLRDYFPLSLHHPCLILFTDLVEKKDIFYRFICYKILDDKGSNNDTCSTENFRTSDIAKLSNKKILCGFDIPTRDFDGKLDHLSFNIPNVASEIPNIWIDADYPCVMQVALLYNFDTELDVVLPNEQICRCMDPPMDTTRLVL